jgi:hypothetical protein
LVAAAARPADELDRGVDSQAARSEAAVGRAYVVGIVYVGADQVAYVVGMVAVGAVAARRVHHAARGRRPRAAARRAGAAFRYAGRWLL